MTKGECTKPSCKFWHVAGTRKNPRKKTTMPESQNRVNHQNNNQAPPVGPNNYMSRHQRDNQTAPIEAPNPNDFLDLLQRWRTEMMEAMDTKLAMAMATPRIPPFRPHPLEPMQMLAHNQVIPQNFYNPAVGGQRPITTGHPVLVQMAPNVGYH